MTTSPAVAPIVDAVTEAQDANLKTYVGGFIINALGERYLIESAEVQTSYPVGKVELCYHLTGPGIRGTHWSAARTVMGWVASGAVRFKAAPAA